ncbi:MAG: hypothetical protein ACPHWZ_03420, partial [Longimicrobiales bacterium]
MTGDGGPDGFLSDGPAGAAAAGGVDAVAGGFGAAAGGVGPRGVDGASGATRLAGTALADPDGSSA